MKEIIDFVLGGDEADEEEKGEAVTIIDNVSVPPGTRPKHSQRQKRRFFVSRPGGENIDDAESARPDRSRQACAK